MATGLPDTESPDTFTRVELEIHEYFSTILKSVTIRRDELLQQLYQLKQDYLNKEESRKKHIQELEQMISQMDEMNIEQNLNLKLHEDNINNIKEEVRRDEAPTHLPVPGFSSEDLQPLLQQLERIGTVQELSSLYSHKIKPVRSFVKKGNKKGDCPVGVRLDEEENIYECDYNNHRIQVFSIEGEFLSEFGKGQLYNPYDIALYKGWAFVSDFGLDITVKFQAYSHIYLNKSEKGMLSRPRGLTVDRDEVFVADYNNNRIAVLNLGLEFLREFGKEVVKGPCDVKINLKKVIVLDSNKPYNVHVFSKSAGLLYNVISVKDGTSCLFMCLDQFSNIMISGSGDRLIEIFTLEGKLLHTIQCENPGGVAVTDSNTIICAESCSVIFY